MSMHTILIIRNLQNLQDQIADAPGYTETLRAALDRSHRQSGVVGEALAADRHMRAIALTAAGITRQIRQEDDLSGAPGSLSELVLRATRLVLIVELAALREIVLSSEPPPWPFPMPPATIDALIEGVLGDLDDVTRGWRRDHADRVEYREALRRAHAGMRRLGEESAGMNQIRAGVSRLDWPDLQDVCIRIVAVMRIRIDVDPDAPILVRTQWGARGSEEPS